MYSYKQINTAVELYVNSDFRTMYVLRKLGYPRSRDTLRNWYKKYLKNNNRVVVGYYRTPKFSKDMKIKAINHYLETGKNMAYTCRKLGYPNRETLRQWIIKYAPEENKLKTKNPTVIELSQNEKLQVVNSLCTRKVPAQNIANELNCSRGTLYRWKNDLLGKEAASSMKLLKKDKTNKNKQDLLTEIDNLNLEIMKKQMEIDVLTKAAEIIKKDQGINLNQLTNREKTIVIDALQKKYAITKLIKYLNMSNSTYFYNASRLRSADKYDEIRNRIIEVFYENNKTFGYRRIHSMLKRDGFKVSEKIVRRLMKEENLVVPRKAKASYSSYMGEISPAVPNLINRDFHADNPNEKWLTDITVFKISAGSVYLSPIIDCFDGMAVNWTIGTSPNAELVNTMLKGAIESIPSTDKPIIHSDRGAHYRWPGWIEIMESHGLTRSMSKKGYSPDNSACEGFFGNLKNEFFYFRDWVNTSIEEFMEMLHKYLIWHNEKRIKMSLGGMSPLEYRISNGIMY